MKLNAMLVSLALAGSVGLAGLSSVSAAQAPAAAPATAAPMAPKAPSQSNTAAPKAPSLKDCNKQADAKNLTGKDRASFVKDCQAGKTSEDD
jgi:hypothetical protein